MHGYYDSTLKTKVATFPGEGFTVERKDDDLVVLQGAGPVARFHGQGFIGERAAGELHIYLLTDAEGLPDVAVSEPHVAVSDTACTGAQNMPARLRSLGATFRARYGGR